jgi:aerobic carbon-monoxide dehydrogenase large subunit
VGVAGAKRNGRAVSLQWEGSSMQKFGIGQPVARFEDPRLLRGEGRYLGDINLPGQAYAVVLRSPHAHARIKGIDTAAACAVPGVLAVCTGADYAADGLGGPKATMRRKRPDGTPMFAPQRPALCIDRVRYVGDPVAFIVAESLHEAKDAAELVTVDYEPLPSITDTAKAALPGSPAVWHECPDNISHVLPLGDKAKTDEAFDAADHVLGRRYVVTRVHAQFMEPRGALGFYDPAEQRYTLYADCQYPHRVRNMLAESVFKIPESRMRVIANDVGGGFGSKGWQYVEHRLVLWAAKKLGRPVKWACERSEAILADEHGRDNVSDVEIALAKDGRILGLRVAITCNIGAYIGSDRNILAPFLNMGTAVGVYTIPAAYVMMTGILSNCSPTAPYRGAGRPEAIYVLERIIDDAAREFGFDRLEIRRRNLIPVASLPYKNALGYTYDCGDFASGMELALKLADIAGFEARRRDAGERGKLRGLGLVNAIERAAGAGLEFAEIRFNPSGTAVILMGTKNQGQGHETTFKQILHEKLGLDPEEVQYIDGDTDRVAFGMGTNGSRSTVIGGSALTVAADKVIEKGKRIAAHLLEVSACDLAFANGVYAVTGTNKTMTLQAVARAAFVLARLPPGLEGGLYETGTFAPKTDTYPNGCHICEVEVDPETGEINLASYAVVDDVGTVINPLTLKGQIHGGIAQGVGQALMEVVTYDADSGQLLGTSFMDYAMPRADTLCDIAVQSNPVPTKLNPLGAKGAGEAGTVGALPVVMNAILDALAPLGVKELQMPATSHHVWLAIATAARRGAADAHASAAAGTAAGQ